MKTIKPVFSLESGNSHTGIEKPRRRYICVNISSPSSLESTNGDKTL